MRLHGEEILRFCHSALGDQAAAEDTRQSIFVDVYKALGEYQGRGSLRGWLFGIARHRVLDAEKARRRWRWRFLLDPQAGEAQVDERPSPDGELDQPRRAALLRGCLRELAAGVRVVVLLRYQDGLPYQEIGRMTGELPTTVQARVCRALPKLRACLEQKGLQL